MGRDPRIVSVTVPETIIRGGPADDGVSVAIVYKGMKSKPVDVMLLSEEEAIKLAESLLGATRRSMLRRARRAS